MRTRLLAVALALGTAMPAFAADAVVEEVVIVDSAYDWSGVYVGVFGGWAHSRTKATDITGEEYGGGTPGSQLSMNDDGFTVGATLGYNFQHGSWVFGPEVELGWVSNDETYIDPNDDDDGLFTEYGFFGAVTGRVGYAADRTLFYGKGGVAFADMKNAGGEFDGVGNEGDDGKWGFDGDEAGFGDETRIGWTLGAGVEHALSMQWTIKAEYMYADFGSETYGNIDGDFDEPFSFDNQLHTVKIGLNYQF
jgi:outer membrane immunogenic protein